MYTFTVHGARGTIPTSGTSFSVYGGATSCFSIRNKKRIVIVDAGTGIVNLGAQTMRKKNIPPITMLFTHFHVDHIVGLPSFAPVYDKKTTITILGDSARTDKWKATLRNFMAKPYWPVGLGEVAAKMTFKNLPPKKKRFSLDNLTVSFMNVPHPQQCLAYRFDWPGNSVVVATDCEFTTSTLTEEFIAFCSHAKHLMFDAQYTSKEYKKHIGWGHSTWETAVAVAKKANVQHLILTHHAPERTDKELDKIVEKAKKVFPNTSGAREEMVLKSCS